MMGAGIHSGDLLVVDRSLEPNNGNVIVAASALPLPVTEFARRAGSGPYPYRVLHGARLDQLIAGARPFSGVDVSPSPDPPLDFFRL